MIQRRGRAMTDARQRRQNDHPDWRVAAIALVPWVLRARDMLGVTLGGYPSLGAWLERVEDRPSVAEEAGVVAAL